MATAVLAWYVLKMRTSSSFVRFRELLMEAHLEFFLPTRLYEVERGGRCVAKEQPLLFSYVFVRAQEADVLAFVRQYDGISIQRQRTLSGEPGPFLTVPNRQMQMFVLAVSRYSGKVPVLKNPMEVLGKGDRVRVLDGPFRGVEGVLEAQQGKDGGRVLVQIGDVLVIPTQELSPASIEVLEFSRQGRHLYQKLDSFEPRLRRTIDLIMQDRPIPEELLSHVVLFVHRFSNLYVSSANSRARFLGMLMLANQVLGHRKEANALHAELSRLLPGLHAQSAIAHVQEMCALYRSLADFL